MFCLLTTIKTIFCLLIKIIITACVLFVYKNNNRVLFAYIQMLLLMPLLFQYTRERTHIPRLLSIVAGCGVFGWVR